jgi:hypothetical protein
MQLYQRMVTPRYSLEAKQRLSPPHPPTGLVALQNDPGRRVGRDGGTSVLGFNHDLATTTPERLDPITEIGQARTHYEDGLDFSRKAF